MREKDRVITELQNRVEELSVGRREAVEKLLKLQTDLDCDLAALRDQERELD